MGSAYEAVMFGLALLVAMIVGAGLVRWARRQVRMAEALRARGWLVIGCPFWTGPQVVPPPGKTRAEIRADIAAVMEAEGLTLSKN